MKVLTRDQAPAAKRAAREAWEETVVASGLEDHLKLALTDESVLERWYG